MNVILKKLKEINFLLLSQILIVISVVYRFYLQFLIPCFNGDEINLGSNLKTRGFIELLYPLDNGQSAPPLYLWLQKAAIEVLPFPFWINIKTISFLVSAAILLLCYKVIELFKSDVLVFIGLLIICFNPFIIYNTLTLKQYGFDLLGVLLLILIYDKPWFKRYCFIFFFVYAFISNVTIFMVLGYAMFIWITYFLYSDKDINLNKIITLSISVGLSLCGYGVYYIWFIRQEGAVELKEFMTQYWQSSFIPLDVTLLKFFIYFFHSIYIYLLNGYEIIGAAMFIVCGLGSFKLVQRKSGIQKIALLLALIIFVHLSFSVLKLYPLSDRLFLYMTIFILILFLSGIDKINYWLQNLKIRQTFQLFAIALLIGSYVSYNPYRDNDVLALAKKLKKYNPVDTISFSPRAMDSWRSFDLFTNNFFKLEGQRETNFNSDIIVTRVHDKLKPNQTAMEEDELLNHRNFSNYIKIDQLSGFNIYRQKNK